MTVLQRSTARFTLSSRTHALSSKTSSSSSSSSCNNSKSLSTASLLSQSTPATNTSSRISSASTSTSTSPLLLLRQGKQQQQQQQPCSSKRAFSTTSSRPATLLRRPRRPYTFTQLVTLSDGSTYQQRSTSPAPVYRSLRDARNTLLWNPSSEKLMNVESDETGRLRAFRARFGRGWDARDGASAEVAEEGDGLDSAYVAEQQNGGLVEGEEEDEGDLMDLLHDFAAGDQQQQQQQPVDSKTEAKSSAKTAKGKKK